MADPELREKLENVEERFREEGEAKDELREEIDQLEEAFTDIENLVDERDYYRESLGELADRVDAFMEGDYEETGEFINDLREIREDIDDIEAGNNESESTYGVGLFNLAGGSDVGDIDRRGFIRDGLISTILGLSGFAAFSGLSSPKEGSKEAIQRGYLNQQDLDKVLRKGEGGWVSEVFGKKSNLKTMNDGKATDLGLVFYGYNPSDDEFDSWVQYVEIDASDYGESELKSLRPDNFNQIIDEEDIMGISTPNKTTDTAIQRLDNYGDQISEDLYRKVVSE